MKKIVALGAIAALAGGMIFADEPAIDMKVAEFTGNAEVKWGVDLDAQQTGFTNSESAKLKVNLWNEGTKETAGDGIWAELKIKGKSANIENGSLKDGTASVEAAKLHFGENLYVNIRSGDTTVSGFLKPDTAVHSDVEYVVESIKGLKFENGIEAGWDAPEFKFGVDFRSYKATNTNYTSAYGLKATAELKDKLIPGLTFSAAANYNINTAYQNAFGSPAIEDKVENWTEGTTAKEGENPSEPKHAVTTTEFKAGTKDYHFIAYGAKAGYKLAIGEDGLYVKPTVGFAGAFETYKNAADKAVTSTDNYLSAGLLFGWGDLNKDANAGVPFLDSDPAKKVSPGIGVVAIIPLDAVETVGDVKTTTKSSLPILIAPSFYLGDKIPGLSAGVYSEIGIYKHYKAEEIDASIAPNALKGSTATNKTLVPSVKENEQLAIGVAGGVAYKLAVGDGSITPKVGARFANSAYVANGLEGKYSKIFQNLGQQKGADDATKVTYAADFLNIKAGVDFAGFINDTTFSINYNSANLLNAKNYGDKKYYNVKLGTVDVGCKISF